MELTEKQFDYLRSIGNELDPSVAIGAGGLTKSVLFILDQELSARELVKVRVPFGDEERRREILEQIAPLSGSVLIHKARHGALLYRPAERPIIELPSRNNGD